MARAKTKRRFVKKAPKYKGFKMSDAATEPTEIMDYKDPKTKGVISITAESGSTGKLTLFIRQPILAEVIANMAVGNYKAADYDKLYKPIMMEHPDPKAKAAGLVATRPAIAAATKNIESAADFSFTNPPRAILISNPDKLREGFSLVIELKTPVPHDTLRKWGEQLKAGCADILTASRPFKMEWLFTESTPHKV